MLIRCMDLKLVAVSAGSASSSERVFRDLSMAHSNLGVCLSVEDFRFQPVDVGLHHQLRPMPVLAFDARVLFFEDHSVASHRQSSD